MSFEGCDETPEHTSDLAHALQTRIDVSGGRKSQPLGDLQLRCQLAFRAERDIEVVNVGSQRLPAEPSAMLDGTEIALLRV